MWNLQADQSDKTRDHVDFFTETPKRVENVAFYFVEIYNSSSIKSGISLSDFVNS